MTMAHERDSLTAQREMYGAPLGEIAASITGQLGLTQGRLAEVLGLSAPMLSQLASGHRVKIGNPAVVHRLQSLLQLVDEVGTLTQQQIQQRLSEVRDEQGRLTGASQTGEVSARPAPPDRHTAAVLVLRASATAAQLRAAAASTDAPMLADLLSEAAGDPARG